jgi:predicted ATPase
MLLVLDNCEHLIDASAAVVERLLDGCSNLRVLVTSRESLRIAGGVTWTVPSLAVPEARTDSKNVLASPAFSFLRSARVLCDPTSHRRMPMPRW